MFGATENSNLSGHCNLNVRLTIPLFAFFAICLFARPTEAKYGAGTGEPNDPYEIATAEQLISIGSDPNLLDKHFVLVNDIDLDPNLPGGRIFGEAVIAPSEIRWAHVPQIYCRPFRGNFDGNGQTIRNLFIESEGEWAAYIGLFGCNEGQVRNINLENINVSGSSLVGGLTGSNQGTITACSISGSITGQSKVGALAGWNVGTIDSCHASGVVWADEKAGGLVGYHHTGTIAFSYSVTLVDGNLEVGGLVGASQEGTVYLSYWDIDTSGVRISAGGRGKHSVEMMSREIYRGWGYPSVWTISDEADYPRLFWEAPDDELIVDVPCIYGGGTGEPNDPFQIWSAEHLVSIGYCPDDFNSCYALMTDIDLNDIDPNRIVPIGTARWPFRGLFDGNGHIISNLTCLSDGQSCVGLFGFLKDRHTRSYHNVAIVKNLHLVNTIIHGGHLTGALVGNNEGQLVTCSITGVVNGRDKTGGLVGSNEGTVDNCRYTGSVHGETGVGGICGQNGSHGRLELCSASGTVKGTENVGGLLGSNYGIHSVAVSCQASSHVFGINQVGGFAGYNGSNLRESYSTGNVTGQTNIGGFVGMNSDDVRACKSSGSVSGST
ncbi:MAG: GLUG motif-containing protein, partial [Planctomycetota bacterium]